MLGYFGPAGTFTHQALLSLGRGDGTPFLTVPATLDAVVNGEIEAGLVPIENSVEGGVSATLDHLAASNELRIVSEVLLPVQFGLYVRPGTTLDDVRAVITHPHAAAQVRGWLHDNIPRANVTEGGSTAAAAAEVARADSRHDAAVCAAVAGELYGLQAAAEGIADNDSAVTRFVLVGPSNYPAPRTGSDKTTLSAYMREDHPGALLDILTQFAVRGINLTRIESRPTKTTLGSYFFSIDLEGHIEDARVSEAMLGLKRVCKDVIFLGSYARADGGRPNLGVGSTDAEYEAAADWLNQIKG